jgi:capsular polysaccharide transport system permease protein
MAKPQPKEKPDLKPVKKTDDDVMKSAPKPAKASMRPQRKRRVVLWASFLLAVLLPAFVTTVYWLNWAPDRFVTQAGFTVRSVDEGVNVDMLSSLTGLSSGGSTNSDTAIVMSYLHSRDLVESVHKDVSLPYAFGRTDDYFYGFHDSTIEKLVDYWQHRIILTHDTTTGLVMFDVQAFTPEESLMIAQSILKHVESLVNDLSEKARADVLQASVDELARAEERLRLASNELRTFRTQQENLNPLGSGEAMMNLIAQTQAELAEVRRELSESRLSNVDSSSPVVIRMENEEESLIEKLANLRSESQSQAELIARYEELELNKTFAQESYAAALSSLEQARVRADSAQRYLAVYQEPRQAQSAVLPNRGVNAALSIIVLFAAWSIFTLLGYHIRDKMA